MKTYTIDANDGIEHFFFVIDEDKNYVTVIELHKAGERKIRTKKFLNKPLFEELIMWGLIRPADCSEGLVLPRNKEVLNIGVHP